MVAAAVVAAAVVAAGVVVVVVVVVVRMRIRYPNKRFLSSSAGFRAMSLFSGVF